MNAPTETKLVNIDGRDTSDAPSDVLRPEDKDDFYHDILDGLSVYLDSPFIVDILHAIREYPTLRLGQSLNLGQVTCKKWVLDTLAEVGKTQFGSIYVLGGWYGVLAAMSGTSTCRASRKVAWHSRCSPHRPRLPSVSTSTETRNAPSASPRHIAR